MRDLFQYQRTIFLFWLHDKSNMTGNSGSDIFVLLKILNLEVRKINKPMKAESTNFRVWVLWPRLVILIVVVQEQNF